jgi:hypothetical protein
MNWIRQLQSRWKVNNGFQITIILMVFACTGFTVFAVKNSLLGLLFVEGPPPWARILYYAVILPVYNILLLFYGFLFGQFDFFWDFEKRSLKKISASLKKKQSCR